MQTSSNSVRNTQGTTHSLDVIVYTHKEARQSAFVRPPRQYVSWVFGYSGNISASIFSFMPQKTEYRKNTGFTLLHSLKCRGNRQ